RLQPYRLVWRALLLRLWTDRKGQAGEQNNWKKSSVKSLSHHVVPRASREMFFQLCLSCLQILRQYARLPDDRAEVRIPAPAGDYMEMKMVNDSSPGAPTEI